MNLDTPLQNFLRLLPAHRKALARLGLTTVRDLLLHFPVRYGEPSTARAIERLVVGEEAVVFGKIGQLKTGKTFHGHVPMGSGIVEDATGKVKVLWFSQPYLAKMFAEGSLVRIEGRVSTYKNGLSFTNPKIEKVTSLPEGTSESLFPQPENHNLHPIYPETQGLSSNWLYHALQKVFQSDLLEKVADPLPPRILKKYSLPSLKTAFFWIHAPRKMSDAEAARKRFAFEEIFLIQLDRQKEKYLASQESSFKIEKQPSEVKQFTDQFPFPLTKAQNRSINAILTDFKNALPMSRLLEGDVGSGKTAVAATVSWATVTTLPPGRETGYLQVAYMAPTEILAEQHFESFIQYFRQFKIPVGLITGSGAKKFPAKSPSRVPGQASWTKISKPQLLKWVENGEIPILIGTHALIQKSVRFKNLGLIIIDEQHKFGVKQRKALRRKMDITPHLLSMTATPIPRTLALTIFGDLDLSLLDELPAGRRLPETKIVLPEARAEIYEKVRAELNSGRQAYVICPRVNDPDPDRENALNAKSVKSETLRLQQKIFPEFEIKGLTGQMSPADKEAVMKEFKENKIQILVATSVIEVGVNVPNATVILIENAERFGLSQLHQLRGRVLRSSFQPYCFVFAETKSQKTITRLKSFVNAKNGFELAEADLQQRGAGDLSGASQWGVSDLAMEALKNIKMVEAARTEAETLIKIDPELKNQPLLKERLSPAQSIHLE